MTITNIVLCGGGPVGYVQFGIFKELIENKYINYKDIENIYSVSIGTITGLILLLELELLDIENYIINRPLDKLLHISNYDYLNMFYTKGLYDINLIRKFIEPLLKTNNLSIDITLIELYNVTKKKFNIFATNLNKIELVNFNYITYPEYKLVDCIYMSCCFPGMFRPYFINNECYIDGGILSNCPYNECIKDTNMEYKNTLIIINKRNLTIDYKQAIKEYNILNNLKSNEEDISNNIIQHKENDISQNDISQNDISENDISQNDISQNNISQNNKSQNNIYENTNIISYFIFIMRQLVSKIYMIENINSNEYYITDIERYKINCCYSNNLSSIFDWIKILTNKDSDKETKTDLIHYGEIIGKRFLSDIKPIS